MELVAISLARVVSFLEVLSLDPFGRNSSLDVFRNIGSRYSFAQVPQTFAEIDFQKGVELSSGKCNGINVDKLTVYHNGIVVDTRTSTEESEKVLHDVLDLARDLFGAEVKSSRRVFWSQLVFRSNIRLALIHPAIEKIVARLTASVSTDLKHPYVFDPAIVIGADLSQTKIAPAAFSIERRAEIPFSENTYFSSAPLRTPEHVELLEQFEASLGI
jgi:hypothetical protein